MTFVTPRERRQTWTPEEDQRLLEETFTEILTGIRSAQKKEGGQEIAAEMYSADGKSMGVVSAVAEDDSNPSTEADDGEEISPELSGGFDRYRSAVDSNLMIFVAKGVVPPFRFKAGGWEFLQSSTELGSAMTHRIAEKGFFMFRVNEDQTGGIELTDISFSSQDDLKAKGK
jgi:hypothetical protein